MRPLPQIAGVVSAAGNIQATSGSVSSALAAILYDGSTAFPMSTVVALCAVAVLYLLVARPTSVALSASTRLNLGEA
jgi:hypothetical protein